MKRCLIALCATSLLSAADMTVGVMAGQKSLDNDDWGSVDQQTVLGLLGVARVKDYPVGVIATWTYGVADSDASGLTTEVESFETCLGFGYADRLDRFLIYAGAGFAFGTATVDIATVSINDSGFGYFLGGGAQFLVTDSIGLGAHLSYSSYNLEDTVSGITIDADAGGFTWAMVASYTW
jgi:opacity protein-like surface antigen